MMAEVLAFLGVCALVICTPGPDTALTIRNSIIGGRRGGLLTAGGIAAGQLTWTIAASVGLAGLLQASQPAFTALKIIGAAYLVFLAAQSILAAVRGHPAHDEQSRQPQDGCLLPQPAPSVRLAHLSRLCRICTTRAGVLPDDLRLAFDLCLGFASGRILHPEIPGAAITRSRYRHRAGWVGYPAGGRDARLNMRIPEVR